MDDEENMKSLQNIDIGFGANSKVKKMSPGNMLRFRKNCQQFFIDICRKLCERSCLKYPLTRAVSCVSPFLISQSASVGTERLGTLLELLHEDRYINAHSADAAKAQFQELLELVDFVSACKSFDFNTRLDEFYFEMIGSNQNFTELWDVRKIVLILSHGNARVEAGFLCPNLKETTLQAQRIVYDALKTSKTSGSPSKSLITPALMEADPFCVFTRMMTAQFGQVVMTDFIALKKWPIRLRSSGIHRSTD